MKGKIIAALALLGAFVSGFAATWVIVEADRFDLLYNGLPYYRFQVSSGGDLTIYDNQGVKGESLSLRSDGGVKLKSYTSAQLAALAPDTTGQLIYNSTLGTVCVSSGVTAGQWVFLTEKASASSTAGGGRDGTKGFCWTLY